MTRKAMDRLAAARPAELDPLPDAQRRERDLSNAMSGPSGPSGRSGPGRPGRRRSARRRTAAVVVTVTAGLLAAVMTAGGRGAHHRPAGGDRAPVALNARTVLLMAADRTSERPGTAGMYWHTVTVDRSYLRAGAEGAGYTMLDRTRTETWTLNAAHGRPDRWIRSQSLGAVPSTPWDRAAWQRAGAPETVTVRVPAGRSATKSAPVSTRPGSVSTTRAVPGDENTVFWLGRNVTMGQLRTLPGNPTALRSWLLRSYTGHGTESAEQPMAPDEWLFQTTAGLITTMPVSAQVRSAAFRMLAGLPSVTVLGEVSDAEGRRGVAITVPGTDPATATERRLIFDPATGRALADETVVTHPSGNLRSYPPGSPLVSSTVLTADWTATAAEPPR